MTTGAGEVRSRVRFLDIVFGWEPPEGCHLVVRHAGRGVATLGIAAGVVELPLKSGQDLSGPKAIHSALDALASVVLEHRDAAPWRRSDGGLA